MTEPEVGRGEPSERLVGRAPLSLRIARGLERRNARGGTALLRMARRAGFLNRIARYQLGRGVHVDVPLRLRPLDEVDVNAYEQLFVTSLAQAIDAMREPTTLFDCGADVGLFAALLVARCPSVVRVVAIEPNDKVFPILTRNIAGLGVEGEAMLAAVGDAPGRGSLQSPAHDPQSDVARYVVPVTGGEFPVLRLDDIEVPPGHCVAIKCDVEGAEFAVIRGARETLRRAKRFVVGFEVHPQHVERTGIEPMRIVRELRSIRDVSMMVAECPDCRLDDTRPLLEQLPAGRIVNMVCASVPRAN